MMDRSSRRVFLGRSAAVAALTLPMGFGLRQATAAASDTAITAPIATLGSALLQAMRTGQATFPQRYNALAPAVDQAFDLENVLQVSVGSYWRSLPPTQQQKLLQAFRAFIIATYVSNFKSYSGQTFSVSPEVRAVGAERIVSSKMAKPEGDVLRMDYVMHQTPLGWRAKDILLDGTISRVAVQRSDFASQLAQGDASRLIASLDQKVSVLSDGSMNV
jgi:phospholipid transport system substrate-binding protein